MGNGSGASGQAGSWEGDGVDALARCGDQCDVLNGVFLALMPVFNAHNEPYLAVGHDEWDNTILG